MRFRYLLIMSALLAVMAGCAGGTAPAVPTGKQSMQTFEVSRVQLTVAPKPKEASKRLFDMLAGPYMTGTVTGTFTNGLSGLLKRDLGISMDYSRLRSNFNYKTSQKAGFVWDSYLYAWQAIKKLDTGKYSVQIESIVPNPTMTAIETNITVSDGGTVLRKYQIRAVMDASVSDAMYYQKAQEYFSYIPDILSTGITGFLITSEDIGKNLADFREMQERIRLGENPPEADLKRMRDMVTDVDPSSGIVLEKPEDEPAPGQEKGSGATLLD